MSSNHPAFWWLYMLLCDNTTLYTGVTTDVKRRFQEHVAGSKRCARYTRAHHRFEMVYAVQVGDRSKAQQLEYKIKRLTRRQKEFIIKSNLSPKKLMKFVSV